MPPRKQRPYDEWIATVDVELARIVRGSVDDFPDMPWREWHARGDRPRKSAWMAVFRLQRRAA